MLCLNNSLKRKSKFKKRVTFNRFVISIFGLVFAAVCYAQNDTLQRYYQVDFHQDIDNFEREHEPIDGNVVPMIPFRQGKLFGFVSPGNPDSFVITPRFEQVYGVYEFGAIVKDTNYRYGFINL